MPRKNAEPKVAQTKVVRSSAQIIATIEEHLAQAIITAGEQIIAQTTRSFDRVEKLEQATETAKAQYAIAREKSVVIAKKAAKEHTQTIVERLARIKASYEKASLAMATYEMDLLQAETELKEVLLAQRKFTGLIKAVTMFIETWDDTLESAQGDNDSLEALNTHLGDIDLEELEQADAEREIDGDDEAYEPRELPLNEIV